MQLLSSLLRSFRCPRQSSGRVSTQGIRQWRLAFESLEDRLVPSTFSSIVSNFNGTAIPAGDTVWFSSVFKASGVGSAPVTVHVTGQSISFSAGNTNYQVFVPDSTITLSSSTTTATTTYDTGSNRWVTALPSGFSGNGFLGGVGFRLNTALPGGINPVTWQGNFSADTAGVSIKWQWAAAVYKPDFSADNNALGVKPLDASSGTLYQNSDHAGTPENCKTLVTGGARGGGGSNFTGSLSATKSVTPSVETLALPASLSGYVYRDSNESGTFDTGEAGLACVAITLSGMDTQSHIVNITMYTDDTGYYAFTGLQAGTYSVTEAAVEELTHGCASVGTVNGTPVGTADLAQIYSIVLHSGDDGIYYNFGELGGGPPPPPS